MMVITLQHEKVLTDVRKTDELSRRMKVDGGASGDDGMEWA